MQIMPHLFSTNGKAASLDLSRVVSAQSLLVAGYLIGSSEASVSDGRFLA